MNYCETCKLSFDNKETVCPGCHKRLIPIFINRESSAAQPDSSWVVVGGVKDKLIGEMAIDTLGSNNIPSMFLPSLSKKDLMLFFGNQSGTKTYSDNLIMVPSEFREEAILVLTDILGDAFDTTRRKNHWI